MLVFIDESGDPGLKLDSGSTDYFIVTLVAFEDRDEATAADQRIQLLKGELGFPPSKIPASVAAEIFDSRCGMTRGSRARAFSTRATASGGGMISKNASASAGRTSSR